MTGALHRRRSQNPTATVVFTPPLRSLGERALHRTALHRWIASGGKIQSTDCRFFLEKALRPPIHYLNER
ncbi:hypothetical protein OPV22_032045 [Ensete ventricosum]|uniref:Uncharacterized protein n=1 Tax=Ensete ventricosum TaxID=4639 RepID=A0AAV8PY77_ENSVE|nr:hypothetical protein OPV22_032045 [Ensete ventricosum]